MPIAKRPPEDVEKAFLDALVGPLHTGRRKGVEGGQVYTIRLAKLAEGKLEDARKIGWQCLTSERDIAVGGDVGTIRGGSAAIVKGPVIDAAARSLSRISADQRFNSDNYELRVLRLPALALEAFWLHSLNGGTDHVVPYMSPHRDLVVDSPYSRDEFVRAVRPLIEAFRKQTYAPL